VGEMRNAYTVLVKKNLGDIDTDGKSALNWISRKLSMRM
jgi:hypothetical protein